MHKVQHASILKTLNILINQLHLFFEYIKHKYIYIVSFLVLSIRTPSLTTKLKT
jgi:hypothetical protein